MQTSSSLVSVLLTIVAAAAVLPGQPQARLLADVETTPEPLSSRPVLGADLNGVCFFAATDLVAGRELWKTTPQGPVRVKDIHPGPAGSDPTDLVVFQGRVWFAASDGVSGRELWATDGTAAGTVLVADLEPGAAGSEPKELTVCGTRLFFSAFETGAGREPHVSDGTAAGTRMVKDIHPGLAASTRDANHFRCCNGLVVFFADDGTTGREPWRSDGTAAGTFQLRDVRPGVRDSFDNLAPPLCCNGKVFFRATDGATGVELHATDGSVAGTTLVKDIRAGGSDGDPRNFACLQNTLLFRATTAAEGAELWKSDGTAGGTVLVKDIHAGTSSGNPFALTPFGNRVLMAASDGTTGSEPFVSDGTTAGTVLLADLQAGLASSFPSDFTVLGGRVVFTAVGAGIGTELFATDGTAANTGLVKDVFPGPPSGRPTGMLACNGKVLFRAASPFGDEPFATDGTPAGTALIGDLEPAIGTRGSDPREFVQVAPDRFFFAAATLANGDEPYFFDGATANLLDVVPGAGSSFPRDLTLVGDTLYFTASTTATGRELFRVRPGEQPVLVQDLRPGSASSSPSLLTALGGRRLVMSANNGSAGTEVCTAENGVPGIVVHDLRQGFSSSLPNQFQVMHDPATGLEVAVFAADDGVVGRELFVTDGSTVTLGLDLEAGAAGSSPGQLAANADGTAVLFTATRGADTTVRRVTVAEANDTFLLSEEELANLARSFLVRRLFEMVLANVPIRIALMRESGTPVVGDEMYELRANNFQALLRDINPGPADSNVIDLMQVENRLYFTAETADHGHEAFTMDIASRTFTMLDSLPGFPSGSPRDFAQFGNDVHFTAETPQGTARMTTNGLGTLFLADHAFEHSRGVGGKTVAKADPGGLREAGATGAEPHVLDAQGADSSRLGHPCNGRSRTLATPPRIGTASTWNARFGPAGHIGVMVLDAVNAASTPLGACELWVDLVRGVVVGATVNPSLTVRPAIPNDTGLLGQRLVLQTLWVNAATVFPILTSDAAILTVGR